jgi:putative membrane protein
MFNAIFAFVSYFATAVILLGAFVLLYVWVTPYKEFKLIREGNSAAAVTLAGAVLGFTFPLMASIYYTQSLLEMTAWAGITCVVQLLVFLLLRRQSKEIEQGRVAPAMMVATFSIAAGLLNAVCISH